MAETGEVALERARAPELDAVLGQRFPVLDDGFVRAVDYMGSDAAIVQAARVSYGQGTKQVHEDRGLIRYLMRHDHTTPFEMCEIKPTCASPWTAGGSGSGTAPPTSTSTPPATRRPSTGRSARPLPPGAASRRRDGRARRGHARGGSARVSPRPRPAAASRPRGVPGEDRRRRGPRAGPKDLPLSTYTEAYWKIDLHNLFHFLRLRMDAHAQLEIRRYAEVIGREIVARWCPIAWAGLSRLPVHGLRLSARRPRSCEGWPRRPRGGAGRGRAAGWLEGGPEGLRPNRERREMARKLRDLGLPVPRD